MIWLILAGARAHRVPRLGAAPARADRPALLDPAMLRNPLLRSGLTSFFFQFLLQAGCSSACRSTSRSRWGSVAIDTGIRIMPLSVTLLLAAVGIPKLFPNASPRRVVRLGFLALLAGIVTLMMALDVGVGPGDRHRATAARRPGHRCARLAARGGDRVLGGPDEQSGEVGGLQNTFTNLGASIGTALAGAVLISALTTSFFTGIEDNRAVPTRPRSTAQAGELAGGIPFISDAQPWRRRSPTPASTRTWPSAILEENAEAPRRPAQRPGGARPVRPVAPSPTGGAHPAAAADAPSRSPTLRSRPAPT